MQPYPFSLDLSMSDFLASYGTDKYCLDALYRWRWPQGFICPDCSKRQPASARVADRVHCGFCHCCTDISQGTLFHNSPVALNKAFLAFFLLARSNRRDLSEQALMKRLNIAYNSAWVLRRRWLEDDGAALDRFRRSCHRPDRQRPASEPTVCQACGQMPKQLLL